MWAYWWLFLLASAIVSGIGAMMWWFAASALVQVVAPSGGWLERESRLGTWGTRLMMAGLMLAVIGVVMAIIHLAYAYALSH